MNKQVACTTISALRSDQCGFITFATCFMVAVDKWGGLVTL